MNLRGKRLNLTLVSGIVVLAVAVVFWLLRNWANPLVGYFPNTVLIALAVFAIVLVIQGLRQPERIVPFEGMNLSSLLIAVILLVVWVFLLGPLGLLFSGLVMFLAISLFVREGPIRPKSVLVDAAVSAAFVIGVYLIFTRLLLVPVPPSPFL